MSRRFGIVALVAVALGIVALVAGLWIRFGKTPLSAQALHRRGIAEQRAFRYDSARDYLRRELEIRHASDGEDHPAAWETLRSLARLERETQNYRDEVLLLIEVAVSVERVRGSEHPDFAAALNSLGFAQGHAGELKAAEQSFRRAGRIFRATPDPERAMSLMHSNLSWIAELRGQHTFAEAGYRRVLTWWEMYVGDEHPQTAWTLQHLALVLARQGRLVQAESTLRRALTIREKLEGPESAVVGEILHGLGRVVADRGRADEAVALLERALAVRLEVRPADHPDVRATRQALADLRARGSAG